MNRSFVVFCVVVVVVFAGLMILGSGQDDPEAIGSGKHSPNEGKDALAKAMEAGRIEFQTSFTSLDKSMPNLRWFAEQVEEGDDAQESATLVTPYGPCIEFVGNISAGYSLLFDGNYYHDPHGKGVFVGGIYKNRLAAIHAAEDYCHRWYLSERSKPPNLARDSHIWFIPEEEPPPVAQVPPTPVPEPVPDEPNQPLDANPSPAPIVRQPPAQD